MAGSTRGALAAILLILHCRCLTSLKLSRVYANKNPMFLGQGARLSCDFELEGATLYALKWYKNGSEFYRYMPGQENKITIYDVPGVNIDLQYGDTKEIYLQSVTLDTAGTYICEVSVEMDLNFDTAADNIEVSVISLPKGPTIDGLLMSYSPGDVVKANCTTLDALPPPTLTWYINQVPLVTVPGRNTDLSSSLHSISGVSSRNGGMIGSGSGGPGGSTSGRYSSRRSSAVGRPAQAAVLHQTTTANGLTTSELQLEFTLKLADFQDGSVKLKCTAMQENYFMRSKEVSVDQIQYKYNKADMSGHQDIFGGGGNPSGYMEEGGAGLFEFEAGHSNPRSASGDLMIEAQAAGGPVRDYMDMMGGGTTGLQNGSPLLWAVAVVASALAAVMRLY